jgi:hypothetical protein
MLLLVLVLGITCVGLVGALVFEDQVLIRAGQPDEIRLWLVNDDGMAGIGFSYAVKSEQNDGDGQQCYLHRVRFFLWRGAEQGRAADFCRCYRVDNEVWIDIGSCEDF